MLSVVDKNPTLNWLFRHPSKPLPLSWPQPLISRMQPKKEQQRLVACWWTRTCAPGPWQLQPVRVHSLVSGQVYAKGPWPVTNYSVWMYNSFSFNQGSTGWGRGQWVVSTFKLVAARSPELFASFSVLAPMTTVWAKGTTVMLGQCVQSTWVINIYCLQTDPSCSW